MKQKRSADVVSLAQVDRLFGSGLESSAIEPSVEVPLTPEERVRVEAAWSKGISDLKQEDTRPGVMFTTRNRAASLIQSEMASAAVKLEKLNVLQDGTLEAALDDKDRNYVFSGVAHKLLHLKPCGWIPPPSAPEQ